MRFNTPLRYPGGKGKLTPYLKLVFEHNNLIDGNYVEPYAGGAGVALNLLADGYTSCIHLNDLNSSVYAFWYSVINHSEELCKKIFDVTVTIDEWYKQKAILNDPSNHSLIDIGFSTFFLNRTNRSGILLGGVIGGKNQDGDWKLDARFNKSSLIDRIEKIALLRDRIRLYNLDAAALIKTVLPTLPQKTLIYLDPPYYVKGQGLYQNHYKHDDHIAIADLVQKEIKQHWIVSYDHTPEIDQMYKPRAKITYGINYSAQNRYQGAEVMFFSENLILPDVQNPANLNAA
ncbi:MAG: DNA adenine methylase [Methylotenera sp.]|nr:DNA adenine methylase [Methylotenera sp.]MDP2100852.1 DNA adenine methylase [Methylotenera sp.]MDP2403855.1 DNA adenine methylase [Methylotenera sp.]MDP3094994.1 DNA adenine methylase [Methylotenera sp.]MDP3206320.1 DNA adenine methylase [Methylotenera sp.]